MNRKDIFRFKQFEIRQANAAMKVGTDSDLLGALAEGGRRILDIGTGTGVLTLIMAQRFPQAELTAVEIDDMAVMDASYNFEHSKFASRITLHHQSFQDFVQAHLPSEEAQRYDCIICNPPYFDKSLEAPTLGRTRARHTSSLPFSMLIGGAYDLLAPGGVFSVCLPPEVLSTFMAEATIKGFRLKHDYRISSVDGKPTKRHILVFTNDLNATLEVSHAFLRNADGTRSQWYVSTLQDFLL